MDNQRHTLNKKSEHVYHYKIAGLVAGALFFGTLISAVLFLSGDKILHSYFETSDYLYRIETHRMYTLQNWVNENNISASDTDQLSEWMSQQNLSNMFIQRNDNSLFRNLSTKSFSSSTVFQIQSLPDVAKRNAHRIDFSDGAADVFIYEGFEQKYYIILFLSTGLIGILTSMLIFFSGFKKEINDILRSAIDEFPIVDVEVKLPEWVHVLPNKNEIKMHYLNKIKESVVNVNKMGDVNSIINYYTDSDIISRAYISEFDAGTGVVSLNLDSSDELYNETLKNIVGYSNVSKASILKVFSRYHESEEENKCLSEALKMAHGCGYGIVYPTLKDMMLEKPEIIKQGTRYGVRLKAKASSIHMIKVDVESTFEPIIGTEVQSKELIDYIMRDYNDDPTSIWKSEIFGRSLDEIVKEGIQTKLMMMKDSTRYKLSSTVSKIVNKGSDKLIAIVL